MSVTRSSTNLQTVSMNKDLSQGGAAAVNVLDLLRSDVLSLCQFKDVLFSVDDLQSAVLWDKKDKTLLISVQR